MATYGTGDEVVPDSVIFGNFAVDRETLITNVDPGPGVINYRQFDVDRSDLAQIMELAVDAGILQQPIEIDAFADTRSRASKGAGYSMPKGVQL
ncbi:MAG: hypothetical protein GY725_02010 [bacterium]|nr:hypothetical protein [bacterium]